MTSSTRLQGAFLLCTYFYIALCHYRDVYWWGLEWLCSLAAWQPGTALTFITFRYLKFMNKSERSGDQSWLELGIKEKCTFSYSTTSMVASVNEKHFCLFHWPGSWIIQFKDYVPMICSYQNKFKPLQDKTGAVCLGSCILLSSVAASAAKWGRMFD